MRLPDAEGCEVTRGKVLDYLLNPDHRYGVYKARFFAEMGFSREEWQILAAALHAHGCTHAVARSRQTAFGMRYEVDGVLKTPSGRRPRIRTVWQVDEGAGVPRLITAHPLEKTT